MAKRTIIFIVDPKATAPDYKVKISPLGHPDQAKLILAAPARKVAADLESGQHLLTWSFMGAPGSTFQFVAKDDKDDVLGIYPLAPDTIPPGPNPGIGHHIGLLTVP